MTLVEVEASMPFDTKEEEEQYVRGANLALLLQNYQPSRLSQTDNQSVESMKLIQGVASRDIVLGRHNRHPGNVLARKIMVSNSEYYRTLSTETRKIATDALIGYFESHGVRFLEPLGKHNTFRPASFSQIVDRFKKALQDHRTSHRRRSAQPQAVVAKVKKIVKKTSFRNTATHASNPPQSKRHERRVVAGDRLAILWPEDSVYYPGTVTRVVGPDTTIRFLYEDGEKERLDLTRHTFVVLGKSPAYEEYLQPKIPPAPSSTEPFVSADALSSRRVSIQLKTSPDNSVQTQEESTGGPSASSSSATPPEQKPAPLVLAGKFKPTVAAPAASSFAAFLSSKIKKRAA